MIANPIPQPGLASVGLSVPSIFAVAGSPVSTSGGSFAITLVNQAANAVFAGPASGVNAAPAFRVLVASDIPALAIGGVTGLQTALDAKAPLTSPMFTGTVTAPAFAGALTGNATTATTAGTISGSITESQVTGLSTDLAGKEPAITAGLATQYIRGNKTLGTFASDVQGAISPGTGIAVAAGAISIDFTRANTWSGLQTFSNGILTVDTGTGSNNAIINLVGRNGGVGATAQIFADFNGNLNLSAAAGGLNLSGIALLALDRGSGSSNAQLSLVGRNAGTAGTATILANQLGSLSINPAANRQVAIGASPASGALFQVQSLLAAQVVSSITAIASQTADDLQLRDSGGNTLTKFDAAGNRTAYGVNDSLLNLPVPATPTISNLGTAGSATWSYTVAACNAQNPSGTASAAGSTATGNATLTSTNKNRVTIAAVNGATSFNVYRTVSGGTPSTLGLIGSVAANGTSSVTFDDIGVPGTTAAPTTTPGTTATVQRTKGQTNAIAAYTDESGTKQSYVDADLSFKTNITPTVLTHVATKKYVDNAIQPIASALTGTTTVGSLTFTGNAQFRKRGRQFCIGVAPGFEQWRSDFSTHLNQWDGTSFTGSTSFAAFESGEVRYTSSAAHSATNRTFQSPAAPYWAIEQDFIITPGSATSALGQVGVQDAADSGFTDYLMAYLDVVGNTWGVSYKGNPIIAAGSFTPDTAISGAYNFTLALVCNANFLSIFYRNNDTSTAGKRGWRQVGTVDGTVAYLSHSLVGDGGDMTLVSNLARYRYCFGHSTNASGSTFRYREVRVGLCGMSGASAYQPITYEDGTPYRDGPWMYAANCNNGFAIATGGTNIGNDRSCHASIVRIHQDTLEIQETAKLFFRQTVSAVDHIYGHNDFCCVFDRAAGGFQLLVTPWGDATSVSGLTMPSVGLWGGLVKKDILHGVHVLSLTNMLSNFPYVSTPTTTSACPEDPALVQINGTWYCAQTAGSQHLFTATPNGGSITSVTWTRVGTAVGVSNIVEGSRFTKVGGQWRVLSACSDSGGTYRAYDLTLSSYTAIAAPWVNHVNAIAPHANIFPRFHDGATSYLFWTFDYSTYGGQDYAVGDYFVFESAETNAGHEFAPVYLK